MSCNKTSRSINLYYRTKDLLKPELRYAENPATEEVACVASFVPTFEPPNPLDELIVVEDEEPEQNMLSDGSEFHFIFLVDRSGSMRSRGRIDSA